MTMMRELREVKIFTTTTSILGQNISEHYSRILQECLNPPIPQLTYSIRDYSCLYIITHLCRTLQK